MPCVPSTGERGCSPPAGSPLERAGITCATAGASMLEPQSMLFTSGSCLFRFIGTTGTGRSISAHRVRSRLLVTPHDRCVCGAASPSCDWNGGLASCGCRAVVHGDGALAEGPHAAEPVQLVRRVQAVDVRPVGCWVGADASVHTVHARHPRVGDTKTGAVCGVVRRGGWPRVGPAWERLPGQEPSHREPHDKLAGKHGVQVQRTVTDEGVAQP
mmetsp:Transcript_29444/g.88179  ORF Transcript_29444/g.88179 Transcript_29444/m.88179 type:complete len:214 (+) Transcript_29444:68-709(+)